MPPTAAIQKLQGPQNLAGPPHPPGLFPAGLTVSRRFNDIDDLTTSIKDWNHEGIQLEPGEFRSRLDLVHTAGLQIHRVYLSVPVLVRGFGVPGSKVFGIQTDGIKRANWRTRPMAVDDVVTFDGRDEIDFQTTGPMQVTVVSVDRELLAQHVEAICGKAPAGDSAADRLRIATPEKAESVIRAWTELTDSSLTFGAQLVNHDLARQFEAKMLELLLMNVSQSVRDPDITERRSIAHRARRYMILNMDQPMTIMDICTAVGAAERTLHLGFRECFGMTPKKFLKLLRLNAARRSLKRPETGTTVTGVALRWGFFHLARFAAEYQQLFAEMPSETLRRAGAI